jgi:hypothetical protein
MYRVYLGQGCFGAPDVQEFKNLKMAKYEARQLALKFRSFVIVDVPICVGLLKRLYCYPIKTTCHWEKQYFDLQVLGKAASQESFRKPKTATSSI